MNFHFVWIKFWNSNAIFRFRFSFYLSRWISEFVPKLFPKTISTSGPCSFFQPITIKIWAKDFGLKEIFWVVFIFSIHSYNSNGQDASRRNAWYFLPENNLWKNKCNNQTLLTLWILLDKMNVFLSFSSG